MALLTEPAATVVLVTMDGVRIQELLDGADGELSSDLAGMPVMENMMTTLVPKGVFLGNASKGSRVHLGNPMGISMPGYQAIFSGGFKLCVSNQCGPLSGNTLLTDIAEKFDQSPVFFSGYQELCDGVAARQSAARAFCGRDTLVEYAERLGLDAGGSADSIVIDVGLERLQNDPPKLVYLGFENSDSVGHSGNYPNYLAVLEQYDAYLALIWAEVEKLNAAGHPTTLIVTTDHGRGYGSNWTQHRWNVPGTGNLWIFAAGHGVVQKGVLEDTQTRSLYDIRPTVEYLLGAPAQTGFWGEVITELFAQG